MKFFSGPYRAERSLGRIAGVSEMTSSSSLGSTRIILQFDFDRDINGRRVMCRGSSQEPAPPILFAGLYDFAAQLSSRSPV
ncbi:hypothetical protein EC971742_2510 [Escherichia coli 97.1742]|nr:hypothetical protein [Escherichia coli]EKW76231.1 hypothetical protein EC971742_2510 [Escherichia coli 97.1742]